MVTNLLFLVIGSVKMNSHILYINNIKYYYLKVELKIIYHFYQIKYIHDQYPPLKRFFLIRTIIFNNCLCTFDIVLLQLI